MKLENVFGLMFGLTLAGLSLGDTPKTSDSIFLSPYSPLVQAFYDSHVLNWNFKDHAPGKQIYHGYFLSGSSNGGILVECIDLQERGSGGSRGAGGLNLPTYTGGCFFTKKSQKDLNISPEPPVLSLEDIITALEKND